MASKRNKAATNKSKKPNKKNPANRVSASQTLPPGHRFDAEIADASSNLLLMAQMRRIEQPTSIENFLKAEIRKLVAQRKLSKISTLFFENILDLAREFPLNPVCQKLLEVTYDEYCIVKTHMEPFEGVSMKTRILTLLNELKGLGWHVDDNFKPSGTLPDSPFCCLVLYNGWESVFDENGRLTESIPLGVRTEDINALTEMAYEQGVLFYRESKKHVYFKLIVHPDNNIPGIPMSPPSVREKSDGERALTQ